MISSTMCCQWLPISLFAILVLPAIHLASAGIARQRNTSLDRQAPQRPSSESISTSATAWSSVHSSVEDADKSRTMDEDNLPTVLPSFLEDSEIELPEGFKFVGLDENNTPFIIIPNVNHLFDDNTDIRKLLKSAMQDAHRMKRSPLASSASSSSSSASRQCQFDYQVTVRKSGRCVRFGDFPACLSGDQLYPFARGC